MDRIKKATIKLQEFLKKRYCNFYIDQEDNTYQLYTKIGTENGQVMAILYQIELKVVMLEIYMPDCMYDYDLAYKEVEKLNSLFQAYAEYYDPACKSITLKINISFEAFEEYTEVVAFMMMHMVDVLKKIANTNKN
ncbi:MAG: hypothetical protein J1E98_01135 [Lachnospiraceae bacterium]|nr:hypothetical protein [Lachnospiraceae bacterium]